MADRVLSELAGRRGRLTLVIRDRHEPTSHELTWRGRPGTLRTGPAAR